MAISAGLGLGGSRSGVCTSTTRPSAPYEGMVIYETDTDRVLVWNSSAWVMPNQSTTNPLGLEFISNVSFTGARPAQAVGVFTSTYTNYRIIANVYGAATEELYMRFYSGTTTEVSTSNYNRYGLSQTTSGAVTSAYVDSGNRWQLAEVNSSSATINPIVMDIFNPNTATRTTASWSTLGMGNGQHLTCTGQVSVTTQFTGFLFSGLNNNISGNIRIYGYRD